jgi:uncharacterized protein YndB with AHSA1/START domain
MSDAAPLSVSTRLTIDALPATVFEWWTLPEHLLRWWGPRPVVCDHAEVDLRVGGRYRLRNRLADGAALWIEGEFERIERPHHLTYTWRSGRSAGVERVQVEFVALQARRTEVIVTHERIADERTARSHAAGWEGCLESLATQLTDRGA